MAAKPFPIGMRIRHVLPMDFVVERGCSKRCGLAHLNNPALDEETVAALCRLAASGWEVRDRIIPAGLGL
jgi:hypothetical protein